MLLKEIKSKIALTQNISEITKALELVSAVKMRKAQRIALRSRPFTQAALTILRKLSEYKKEIEEDSIYFKEGKGDAVLAVVVTSDKGFCGSFNRNILNFSDKEIKKVPTAKPSRILDKVGKKNVEIFAIGKKAAKYFKKHNYNVLVEFSGIGDYAELEEVTPVADLLIRYFKEGKFRKILFFYTDFISTFSQKPLSIQAMPLDLEKMKDVLENYALKEKQRHLQGQMEDDNKKCDYILEPSAKDIFENLVPQLFEYLIYHSVLEANAAEHSARMMAMRSASENAKDVMGKLRLEYNKARQTQITAEVTEISSAKEVLE